jgi:curved DNA-binding protein CbpA
LRTAFQMGVVALLLVAGLRAEAAPFRGKADGATLYQILGVAKTASSERIDEAYAAGLAKLDPSQNPQASSLDPDGSWLKNLISSYEIVSSVQKRAIYDGFLKEHTPKPGYGAQHIQLLERSLRLAKRQRGEQARLTAADLQATVPRFTFVEPVRRRTRSGPPPFQGKPGGTTLYSILGVSATADAERIEQGYEVALGKLDPTRNPNARENDPDGSYLKNVKRAYAVLSKPQRRMPYDNFLLEQTTGPGSGLQHLDWVENGVRIARRSRGSRARLTALDINAAKEKSKQKKKVRAQPKLQLASDPAVPPTVPALDMPKAEEPPVSASPSKDTLGVRCRLGYKELGVAVAGGVGVGAAGQTIIQNMIPSAPSETTRSVEVPDPNDFE